MRTTSKQKQNINDKKKGPITQSTGQKNIEKGHSIERVCYSASRKPSDTLSVSQLYLQLRTLKVSGFSIGTVNVA